MKLSMENGGERIWQKTGHIFIILALWCFFHPILCSGQGVYLVKDPFNTGKRTFDESVLEELKKTTTVFFYGEQAAPSLDSLKQAITQVWDLSPLIFVNYDSASYYESSAYSRFVIKGGRSVQYGERKKYKGDVVIDNNHYYLSLEMPFESGLARIELAPTILIKPTDIDSWKLYNRIKFANWSPVFLKAQLMKVVADLKNSMRTSLFFESSSTSLKDALGSDTLYISDRNIIQYTRPVKKEKTPEKGSFADLFNSLPFPFRICSDAELYNLFVTENKGRYLFEYVNSEEWKFITIYDLKDKDIVYRAFSTGKSLNKDDIDLIK